MKFESYLVRELELLHSQQRTTSIELKNQTKLVNIYAPADITRSSPFFLGLPARRRLPRYLRSEMIFDITDSMPAHQLKEIGPATHKLLI